METWWTFLLFYAVFFPIGVGFVYWPPIICGWEWFPEHKGLVSGLIVGGYGFGAFIFGFITTAIINPEDLKDNDDGYFPESVGQKFPSALRICLTCWALLSLFAVLLIKRNPDYDRWQKIKDRRVRISEIMKDNESKTTERTKEEENNDIGFTEGLMSI